MKVSDTAKNWIMAIGLLIFAGLASAAWLYFSSQESSSETATILPAAEQLPVTIQIEDYVLGSDLLQIGPISDVNGTEISQGMVILGAVVLVTVLVGGLGLLITVITWFTSRQVTSVVADERYQEGVATLNSKEKEHLKEWHDSQPPAELPTQESRKRSSWFATSLLIILLVWITGLILSFTFLADITWTIFGIEVSASLVVNLLLIVSSAVLLVLVAKSSEPNVLDSGASDNYAINWGTIWVIVTGLLIVGVGTGLAIAMRSIG